MSPGSAWTRRPAWPPPSAAVWGGCGGIARGYDDPKDQSAKKAHYALVQEFARRFREANGSIVCRELLNGIDNTVGGAPAERTPEYYAKRPCPNLAACAAEILDEMLELFQ